MGVLGHFPKKVSMESRAEGRVIVNWMAKSGESLADRSKCVGKALWQARAWEQSLSFSPFLGKETNKLILAQ